MRPLFESGSRQLRETCVSRGRESGTRPSICTFDACRNASQFERQANTLALFCLRTVAPTRPNPAIISAQVPGSGTDALNALPAST